MLFLAQIEGAPALAARVLLKTHEEDILELMDQLPDWEWVYPSTYLHIMELRLPLPAALYRQPVEKMANLIAALAKAAGVLPYRRRLADPCGSAGNARGVGLAVQSGNRRTAL